MATIVLGTAFGDEGKGKLVDILSRDVQLCARAQVSPSYVFSISKSLSKFRVKLANLAPKGGHNGNTLRKPHVV